jgi:hypothetical protein
MDYEWMLALSNKEKKDYSYKLVPLSIIDELFKKRHDKDPEPWPSSKLARLGNEDSGISKA